MYIVEKCAWSVPIRVVVLSAVMQEASFPVRALRSVPSCHYLSNDILPG